MKAMAKEGGVKGKNLFHPVRLALTGEMSGQDVTKQLALLTLATSDNSIIDAKKAGIVPLSERMEKLRSFCESIPEEFRQPKPKEEKKSKEEASAAAESAATVATTVDAAKDPKDEYE